MFLRVGISTSYEGLVLQEDIYPIRISGDILQAYWIVNYLRENKNLEFRKIDKNNDINHFFYLPIINRMDCGINFGFNPNFFDFSKYSVFTSSSWFSKIFSFIPYFRQVYSFYRKRKFIKEKGLFFRENLKLKGLKYIIFNSRKEKEDFENFLNGSFLNGNLLEDLGMIIQSKNLHVIYNPLDHREIDYLVKKLEFSIFDKMKKDYGLPSIYGIFVGRFDRIKNIDRFTREYVRKGINKRIPFIIAGKVMDYDKDYYRIVKNIACNQKNIFVLNIDDLKGRYLEDYLKFLGEKVGINKRKYFLERKMILELIKHSNFLVVPSWVESFGFTVLEALYLNKPVIVTKNSPYEEVLPEIVGKNIKMMDPLFMNLGMDLFDFKNLENSDNLVKERFDIEKVALGYMEVWNKYG